jgi:hypothetical protein
VCEVAATLLPLLVLALLAFVALGPAVGPFARALGALDEHTCACGMKPGTCGCPACALLLQQGDPARLPEQVATLGSCDDHTPGSLAAPLPLGVLPAGGVVLVSQRDGSLPRLGGSTVPPAAGPAPPTPPPRRLTV